MKRYFRSVEGKLFLLLGAVLSGIGFLAIGIHSDRRIEARGSARVEKYEHTLSLLSASILQFERDAEAKMWLALQHLKHDDLRNVPSRDLLVQKAKQLGMSHFFIIDRSGRFIRSTNEAPELIPNLYSFSDEYRLLLSGPEMPLSTPLIPPDPEIRPYKFLSVFHRATGRFLHAGLRADFMETALSKLVASDPEILEVHILSPNGTSLGRFERGVFRYETERVKLPELIQSTRTVIHSKEGTRLLNWVDSSHPDCGQCRKSGDLRSGRHQYLFSLMIKNESHHQWIRKELLKGLGYAMVWGLLALCVAFGLAKRFTLRIRLLNSLIEQSHRDSPLLNRIEIEGADEVTELAKQFQALLERIDVHQQQAMLVARAKIELEVARQVAHDLRSPLTTLEVLVGSEERVTRSDPQLVQQALRRIRDVADALLHHRSPMNADLPDARESTDRHTSLFHPHSVIEAVIAEKRVEYSGLNQPCSIEFKSTPSGRLTLLFGSKAGFTRMVSNLLNNAQEAHGIDSTGKISVSLDSLTDDEFILKIKDHGVGMAPETVLRLGEAGFSHGKTGGSGIGFHHAKQLADASGGSISVESSPGSGTEVSITLPRADAGLPIQGDFLTSGWEQVIIVDDDPLIHEAWNIQLSSKFPIQSFQSLRAFKQYFSKNFDGFERTFVLMDQDFIHEPENKGLSVLSELGLERQACLVTGRFDEPELMEMALRAGVRVLPKSLLPSLLERAG